MDKLWTILAALFTGVLVLIAQWVKTPGPSSVNPEDWGMLTRFEYYDGGNENGNQNILYLKQDKEYGLILGKSDADWWGQRPIVQEVVVPDWVLGEIQEELVKYDMYSWIFLPEAEDFALDASHEYYEFGFENGELSFDSYKDIPTFEGIRTIFGIINEVAEKYGQPLPGLILEPLEGEENWGLPSVTEGEVTLSMHSIFNHTLEYRLLNGTEEDFSYDLSARIIRLKDGKEMALENNEESGTLGTGEWTELTLILLERLEAGEYRLELGDISCEFEMR